VYNNFEGIYVCGKCRANFYSEIKYDEHILKSCSTNVSSPLQEYSFEQNELNNNNEIILIDSMTDNLHEYESESESESDGDNENENALGCPLCDEKFMNQITLGNHFMETHNSYEQLSILSEKTSSGFPGLNVLCMIKMIQFVKDTRMKYPQCPICYFTFDPIIEYYTYEQYDYISSRENKVSKYQSFIDDTKFLDTKTYVKRIPLKLMCCGANVCSDCLKRHISAKSGEPICMFCIKSHNQTEKQYIVIDERSSSKIEHDPNPYLFGKREREERIEQCIDDYSIDDYFSDEDF